MIGGLSGVMHSVVPVDTQQNDTYFIVAHFHYVLFGGSIFALMGAIYFYWPKAFGKLLDERLGKIQFWLQFAGFNLTFFPMHFLGLAGMPRRYSTYSFESGWWFWNVIATIGALLIATSVLVFLINVLRTAQSEQDVGPNPWDAATLEWAIPSPPPVYNFRIIPLVTHRDQLWHDKYDRVAEAAGPPGSRRRRDRRGRPAPGALARRRGRGGGRGGRRQHPSAEPVVLPAPGRDRPLPAAVRHPDQQSAHPAWVLRHSDRLRRRVPGAGDRHLRLVFRARRLGTA